MSGRDYYDDLIDQTRITSASALMEEKKRVERIAKGQAKEVATAMTNSPIFAEMQKQTQLNCASIVQQEREIEELKSQNAKLESQLETLKKSEADSRKQSKLSFIGFLISNAIALASLLVALLK